MAWTALALSADGGTLYAALAGDSAVAAIQVSSITASSSTATQVLYPLPAGDVPYSVAVQSGKVWVSYQPANNNGAGVAAIGDIDLAASDPTAAFEAASTSVTGATGWYSPPDLAADPSDSGLLVAADPYLTPTNAATFNTTTSPETGLAAGSLGGATNGTTICGDEKQLAVIPGGAGFVAACQFPKGTQVFSPSDVTTPTATYAGQTGPAAVAVSPSGLIAAGDESTDVVTTATVPANVYVYSPAGNLYNTIPVATSSYNQFGAVAGWGALAWSPDGSALYALTATQVLDGITNPTTYSLDVITAPTLTRAAVTLSAPSSVEVTKTVALTGKVTLSNGTLPPVGTSIAITRTLGTATAHFTASTKADGSFTLTDTTAGKAVGAYKYTASYPGSATTAPASGSRTVQVVKLASGLSVAFNATTINYGTTTVVTVHLHTIYTNRTVWVYAGVINHAKKLIGHGNVNSAGNFRVTYKAANSSTFTVQFSGDAHVAGATVAHLVRVRAGVSTSIGGYYGTAKSGGITYRLYTTRNVLTTKTTVSPTKRGQCVSLEIWENDGPSTGWFFNSETECLTLNGSSQLSFPFSLTNAGVSSGIKYRIRADYTPISTDKTNLGNDGGWQYFIVY